MTTALSRFSHRVQIWITSVIQTSKFLGDTYKQNVKSARRTKMGEMDLHINLSFILSAWSLSSVARQMYCWCWITISHTRYSSSLQSSSHILCSVWHSYCIAPPCREERGTPWGKCCRQMTTRFNQISKLHLSAAVDVQQMLGLLLV